MKHLICSVTLLLLLCTSCVSDKPVITPVNGTTVVQTHRRFLGIKVWTSEQEVKTYEQAKADLKIKKAEEEQEIGLNRKKRQEAAAFWTGSALFLAAMGFVVMGYLSSGWKFWGGMAASAAGLGAMCWGMAHWLPYLKWFSILAFAIAAGKTLYDSKDFNLKKWLEARRAAQ